MVHRAYIQNKLETTGPSDVFQLKNVIENKLWDRIMLDIVSTLMCAQSMVGMTYGKKGSRKENHSDESDGPHMLGISIRS